MTIRVIDCETTGTDAAVDAVGLTRLPCSAEVRRRGNPAAEQAPGYE